MLKRSLKIPQNCKKIHKNPPESLKLQKSPKIPKKTAKKSIKIFQKYQRIHKESLKMIKTGKESSISLKNSERISKSKKNNPRKSLKISENL